MKKVRELAMNISGAEGAGRGTPSAEALSRKALNVGQKNTRRPG